MRTLTSTYIYRMSMLAFAVRDPRVDRDRLIKICLVHDLAESVVGDITPFDGVTKEDKRVLEEVTAVLQPIKSLFGKHL